MADYFAAIRTNYFSVKDEDAFRELIRSVIAEDGVHLFEEPQPDGSIKFGFGCYGTINGICVDPDDDGYCDDEIDCFFDALQKLVCEDDAIIIMEAGHEKLRYVAGLNTVITHTAIQSVSLSEASLEIARKLLGNPDYQTQMDY